MHGWIDSHNHLQDPRLGEPGETIAAMREAGVAACVANATCEGDWARVAELAADFPDFVRPAYGIHPWHAHTATPGWQDRLRQQLEADPHASIGECGIDIWVSSPSLGVQMPVFIDQLEIASQTRCPLTIHCLKAWGPLLETLTAHPPTAPFLVHAFNGSLETARQLADLGAYFSFNGYFLHPRKQSLCETYQRIPLDRLLIETDAPSMRPPDAFITHILPEPLNHPANLPRIASALADLLHTSRTSLLEITSANHARCFHRGGGF